MKSFVNPFIIFDFPCYAGICIARTETASAGRLYYRPFAAMCNAKKLAAIEKVVRLTAGSSVWSHYLMNIPKELKEKTPMARMLSLMVFLQLGDAKR